MVLHSPNHFIPLVWLSLTPTVAAVRVSFLLSYTSVTVKNSLKSAPNPYKSRKLHLLRLQLKSYSYIFLFLLSLITIKKLQLLKNLFLTVTTVTPL